MLKHCYCEYEHKKSESKKVHQKGSKTKKKRYVKVRIESRMVDSLQLKEFDVQNTWLGKYEI